MASIRDILPMPKFSPSSSGAKSRTPPRRIFRVERAGFASAGFAAILNSVRRYFILGAVVLWVVGMVRGSSASAAEAGCLFVNANPGTAYGDRAFTNVLWGDGYPAVSVTFSSDVSIVFSPGDGGGQKQRFANNGIAPGNLNNDNPAFISVYTNTLRLNAMIADTGTVTTTYAFTSPMTLVDVIVCDVDDGDSVRVIPYGPGGAALSPSIFELVTAGDLSLTNNASGRPALEAATPPAWNNVSGVLTAAVAWNENRSYTILRVPDGIAVQAVAIEMTGNQPDADGPAGSGLGSHVYVCLWATPRAEVMEIADPAAASPAWRFPSLPGHVYRVATSTDLDTWSVATNLPGPSAPTGHIAWSDTTWTNPAESVRFYRYTRSTN